MGPKPKKKNAADKAAAEEAERLRLEEEARLLELKAKKEKELREQNEREAFEALFLQEKSRLDDEQQEFMQAFETVKKAFNEMKTLEDAKRDASGLSWMILLIFYQWNKFLQCSPLPDPMNEPELNTHLNLWAEDAVGNDDDPSFDLLFAGLLKAEKLCNELAEAASLECDKQNAARELSLRMHLITLRQIILSKWDLATSRIVQLYDQFPCEPNENFHHATVTSDYIFGVWGNLTKNPRHKTIEYPNIKICMTLPKPISLANVAIRMLYSSGETASAPYRYQNTDEHMSVVGGILFLDLFEMPEAPKVLRTMIIRQILSPDGKLKPIKYPFKKMSTETVEEDEEDAENGNGAAADTNIWPAQVSYEIIPQCFIHKESAKMMSWDESDMCWSEENVGDVEINIETGAVKFRTTQFRPTALVQKTYAEFPFQDWSIEPSGDCRAVFRIHGSVNEIIFEAFEGKCQLKSPMTPFLQDYVGGKWFNPALFFMKLSIVGLNFQGPKSLKGVNVDPSVLKSPILEDLVVNGMGLCCNRFGFKRNPSNRHIASTKLAVQVHPVSNEQAIPEDTVRK
ncbi:Protein casc1 [Entophlyctis luteolus]|nr:Protein casc1 [Entophlyctis luteolus]